MKYINLIFILWLFVGCNNQKEVANNFSETSVDNSAEAVSAAEEEFEGEEPYDGPIDIEDLDPIYNSSRTLKNDIIHTKLEVNFDWSNSTMNGIATITAKPHFYETDSLILDAKGMDIKNIKELKITP